MVEEPTERIDSAIRGFQRYTVIKGLSNHTNLCAVFLSMLQLSYSLNLLRTTISVVVKVAIPMNILSLNISSTQLCNYVYRYPESSLSMKYLSLKLLFLGNLSYLRNFSPQLYGIRTSISSLCVNWSGCSRLD